MSTVNTSTVNTSADSTIATIGSTNHVSTVESETLPLPVQETDTKEDLQ